MLSRHFLRAKALQTVYAYRSSNETSPMTALKHFDKNISRLNELGCLQLASLREVVEAGRKIIEEGLHKHLPTEDDLHPSYRVVNNPFLERLFANFDYQQLADKYKFPWLENEDVMRKIYKRYVKSSKFKELISEESSFDNQQRIVLDLFKCIINFEDFRDLFNERSLLWEDDFDQVAQYNYAMIKGIEDITFDESTPLYLMLDTRVEMDMEANKFVRELITTTISHIEESEELIKKHLWNWDIERVALMDILILDMGIAELTTCPSIPERVTVDECIELTKEFSSDKSKIFVNGILDKIIVELRNMGRINKSGRGLYVPEEAVDSDPEHGMVNGVKIN